MEGYEVTPKDREEQFSIHAAFRLAEAVRTGEAVWTEPVGERIARHPQLADVYKQFPFEAWVSLPLMVNGAAIGGLSLSFKQFKQLNQEECEFMVALSRQCAQAIFRAQLYEGERKARAEAERANQVKDEFLAVLSHELRSPLNPILGWSKLLQNQEYDFATVTRGLQTIERNAKLQTQLIEDLLDVSRILLGKLSLEVTSVNLKSTIEAAMETVRLAAAAKAIQIETRFDPHVICVAGDVGRLQQVIWNLLSNAVKFTPKGGQVQITLEQINLQAQIQVSDTGKGITAEVLPYVFDRFRQADSKTTRQFGGLGLGLAIVRQLVELHGGTVHVESLGEGQGATFTVNLPLVKNQGGRVKSEENSLHSADSAPYPLQGVRVLVVDDEKDARELLVFVLEQAGAMVMPVPSATEALQVLIDCKIDVLVSDIGMPDMDGYMLMQQITSQFAERDGQSSGGNPLPKAIALTAYAGEINHQKALAVGFHRHFSKPIDPAEVVAAIANLIKSLT